MLMLIQVSSQLRKIKLDKIVGQVCLVCHIRSCHTELLAIKSISDQSLNILMLTVQHSAAERNTMQTSQSMNIQRLLSVIKMLQDAGKTVISFLRWTQVAHCIVSKASRTHDNQLCSLHWFYCDEFDTKQMPCSILKKKKKHGYGVIALMHPLQTASSCCGARCNM